MIQFNSNAQYILNNDASANADCGCFTITPNLASQSGSAWNQTQLDLNNSFDFTFRVYLGCSGLNGGADGMVFALQQQGTSLGGIGGGMGILGVNPSLFVAMDTWQNGGTQNDPVDDHISLHSNGDIEHDGGSNDLSGPHLLGEIEDCNWHKLRLVWNATSLTFDAYFDGIQHISYTGDIVNNIFGGNSVVFYGFTGGTGWAANEQMFCSEVVSSFNTTTTPVCAGSQIDFVNASYASTSEGSVDEWLWDFGDAVGSDTLPNPSYTYSSSGSYNVQLTVTDADGCEHDTIVAVSVLPTATGTDTRTECNSYTWIDGNTYTASNNSATFNITNGAANGCDSLVTLDLTIINSTFGTDTKTECNSYTWIDGNTYTASNNSATFNITNGAANDCDSLVTLDLTIINSTFGTDTKTECNSYTWIDGNTYTVSNNTATFNIVGVAANGCDSLVTLDLTIVNATSGTDTRTECNSYTWIDGNTYTASNNSATFNITNGAANGCDSLLTLNLTIVNATSGTDTRTECNSYTWIDGNTYTASNNSATFNITNGAANGCDSLVTLDLTINNVTDITTSSSGAIITANNLGATYKWLDCDNSNATIPGETGQSYTAVANGNYAVELTENGCVDTSACVNIITTAILENNFGSEFNIYPNPTKGNFSVDLDKTYNSILITIADLSGRLIESKEYNGTNLLNLKIDEPAGIYLLKIETGNQKAVIRLVKE
jgi:hypothetical protein